MVDINIESNDLETLSKLLFGTFPWTFNFIPEHEKRGLGSGSGYTFIVYEILG